MSEKPLFIPASWKLWALVFRCISGRDSLAPDDKSLSDAAFSYAVGGLYTETCETCRRRLPVEVFSLREPDRVLRELESVVNAIASAYQDALPLLDKDHSVRAHFEMVNRNCRIILSLLESQENAAGQEEAAGNGSFRRADLERWHKIVDGVCFAHTAFADFEEILDLSAWSPEGDASGEGGRLRPLPGYGMAVYAFLLLLMLNRDYDTWSAVAGDWGEEATAAYWAAHFQARIDWDPRDYHIREESWKDAYLLQEMFTDIPRERLSREEETLLGGLLGHRGLFEKVFAPEYFTAISSGDYRTEPVFDQYKYIRDVSVSALSGASSRQLDELYQLLVRETSYLYENYEMIAKGFMSRDSALMLQDFSKWKFESKQKNDSGIEAIYDGSEAFSAAAVLELFRKRREFTYEHLWEQPLICSEQVYYYLTACIVQNERLKTEIRRALGESDLLKALSGKVDERMKKEQNRQDRKDNAVRALLEQGIIDEQCNIRLKNPNGKGKQYRTIELTNFLVGNFYAKPPRGWVNFIETFKNRNRNNGYVVDDRLSERFFTEFRFNIMTFINAIDWQLFDGVFKLNGSGLSGADLKGMFSKKNEKRTEIIFGILKQNA